MGMKPRARVRTYDRARWHSEADDFPAGLPPSAGAKHIGWFLRWAADAGLVSASHEQDHAEQVARLRAGTLRGSEFVMTVCDGTLCSDDLSPAGRAFAAKHYVAYLRAYERHFTRVAKPTYLVPDTEVHYRAAARILNRLRRAR